MSKKDPLLVSLGECPEKWNDFLLTTYRFPQDPSTRKEVQQDCIRGIDSRTKRPRPVTLDEAGVSITQETDALNSLHREAGADSSIALSAPWMRYLGYLDVIAEALTPKDKGAALKRLAIEDARSRYWEQPPAMPSSLGASSEFRQRVQWGEMEIRALAANQRKYVIEIREYPMPPDEPEDLDEAGEPGRHWDGLKWDARITED